MRVLYMCVFALGLIAHRAQAGPVLVELFTSQGCSSCPAADAVLAELAGEPQVIAIACHVTYWDRLGWKDRLGLADCDRRQREYAKSFKQGAYTPQAVVNGRLEAVGSRKAKLQQLIAEAAALPSLDLQLAADTRSVQVRLPQAALKPQARLHLIGIGASDNQAIEAGENKGRKIQYVNPVVYWHTFSEKLSAVQSYELPNQPDVVQWLLLVQSSSSGAVLAVQLITVDNRSET